MRTRSEQKALYIFFAALALTSLGLGLSDSVFSNYFKDAYGTDAFSRGVIELPRELPGILSVFIISALAFLGDIRMSLVAQALSAAGLVVLGLATPPFGVMLIFLFINSVGMHLFMPLADGIGMTFAKDNKYGTVMGNMNGVRTAFSMAAGVLVFAGFKSGFFSFTTAVKPIFLIAAACFVAVFVLLASMPRQRRADAGPKKARPLFKKEYGAYYLLAALYGARKQIMYVYGPWVLIELLDFGADSMALLSIAGAAAGIFLMPAIGRWIDRFGIARIMAFEAAVFLGIYAVYGALCAGLHGGWLASGGYIVAGAVAISMADRMTMQFGMVRAVFMRSIAASPEDVTPALSAGMMLDHVLSIIGAFFCGYLWKTYGPQYVFALAALISAGNMAVASKLKKKGAA